MDIDVDATVLAKLAAPVEGSYRAPLKGCLGWINCRFRIDMIIRTIWPFL